MAQAQKTQTKAATKPAAKQAPKVANAAAKAAAKVAPKAAAKPEANAAAVPTITALIVTGIADRIAKGSRFYANALAYHAKAKTSFPRARNNERRAALNADKVAEVMRQHDAQVLAAGNGDAQAMFDVYMMNR